MPNKQVPAAGRRKPPAAGKGRVRGTPNKVTTKLKEAILLAAEQSGYDQRGRDGLTGYLRRARRDTAPGF